MTSSGRVRRPARRASSGTGTKTFSSHADTTPTLPPRPGAMCAGPTSRTWTSGTEGRGACPVDSPRPSPSLGDHARIASAQATRMGHTTSSSVGARSTVRAATAHRARRARPCTTRREGDTRPARASGRPTDRGPLPTANRHNVMMGQFGRRGNALESTQRQLWLDAVMPVTGFNPRELRPTNDDRPRRGHRYVPLASDGGDGLGAALAAIGRAAPAGRRIGKSGRAMDTRHELAPALRGAGRSRPGRR